MKCIEFTTIEGLEVVLNTEFIISITKKHITEILKNYYINSTDNKFEIDELTHKNIIKHLREGKI